MPWHQTRPCGGICRTENRHFPTKDGESCIYLDPEMSLKRCLIQHGAKAALVSRRTLLGG